MEKQTNACNVHCFLKFFRKQPLQKKCFLLFAFFMLTYSVNAQQRRTIKGTVVDDQKLPLIGATITVKGTNTRALTNSNGDFSIEVPEGGETLVVAYVSMISKEVNVTGKNNIQISLYADDKALNEVIVVGYGQQKKSSVTGSIVQTTGKVLERTGGITNLGMALTGNLPGVITSSSSGMPGSEDPQILIRGQSSWNNSSPLILVDGIERSISAIDISSVESVSVLKDASATAIFGVRGANGVILVTTKRGVEGKAQIQVRSNMTAKVASKLPEKYDSYDALMYKNRVLEKEGMADLNAWSAYAPMERINKYRNPANSDEWDRYPNVDWVNELFKDHTMSYNTAANVSGGTKFVNYFAGVDFTREGDLFKTIQNNRGYNAGFGYNRTNVRSNLDFNLTKTTKLSTNLFGSNGVRQLPYDMADGEQQFWSSAYRTSPDIFRPKYSDGTYGFYVTSKQDQPNAAFWLAYSGVEKRTNTQLTTDFILQQQLDVITQGLNFRGSLSLDNSFLERKRGIDDRFNSAQRKYINPITGLVSFEETRDPGTQFDFNERIAWGVAPGEVDKRATYRNANYQFQLNYARTYGDHELTAMGVFQRQRNARGNDFPTFREDWVYRTTYNYKSKYSLEANGAYNGSEKFGPERRFAFFPSFSAGWMLNKEHFMKGLTFIDQLKLRGSWGRIGDDGFNTPRWPFRDAYSYGGNAHMGNSISNTPYTFYRISTMGNPILAWEIVEKRNFAVDYSFLKGKISGNVDFFKDERSDIVIGGESRAIPSFYGFGGTAARVNSGKVTSTGYEVELRLNHSFGKDFRVWANTSITHAKNITNFRDDPELTPAYQQQAGYSIGQVRTPIDHGFIQSWDDIYGSTTRASNNGNKLPGDYNIIDFNGDGIIDGNDSAPYGYTSNPENTYNASLGIDWKGLSLFVQFYGVNNVTREVTFLNFQAKSNVVFLERPYWNVASAQGEIPLSRFTTNDAEGNNGTRFLYDGSYLRLKNVEVGYKLSGNYINKIGLRTARIYLGGNNLWLWSKLPDDRESNFSGNSGGGAYPTMRRFNLGLEITL